MWFLYLLFSWFALLCRCPCRLGCWSGVDLTLHSHFGPFCLLTYLPSYPSLLRLPLYLRLYIITYLLPTHWGKFNRYPCTTWSLLSWIENLWPLMNSVRESAPSVIQFDWLSQSVLFHCSFFYSTTLSNPVVSVAAQCQIFMVYVYVVTSTQYQKHRRSCIAKIPLHLDQLNRQFKLLILRPLCVKLLHIWWRTRARRVSM